MVFFQLRSGKKDHLYYFTIKILKTPMKLFIFRSLEQILIYRGEAY
jgi:hypothetical protein